MKLYDVPAGAKIRLKEPETDPKEVYKFFKIDGMYSYCTDKDSNTIHLAAWTEVEIIE